MEVALASYIYISYDSYDVDVGAGDIATGPYNPQLTHDTHTMVTKMYNEMVNGSLPVSILEIQQLFVASHINLALKDIFLIRHIETCKGQFLHLFNSFNITEETLRDYHYIWYSYLTNRKITI